MYFDPGIGSLIIQALIGIAAVCGGYFAFAKTKLKDLFSRNKDKQTESKNLNDDEL